MKQVLAALLCCAVVGGVQAQDDKAKADKLAGSLDLGYGSTSGNTDTESFSFRSKVEFMTKDYAHELDVQALSASQNGITNKERYFSGYQIDKDISKHVAAFARADYEKDRFANIDNQYTAASGASISWLLPKTHRLKTDLGLGYRVTDSREVALGEDKQFEETIVRMALDYQWKISETARFNQKATSDKGRQNTVSRSDTTLRLTVSEPISVVLGLHYKFVSNPPGDARKVDRETKVAVSYSF